MSSLRVRKEGGRRADHLGLARAAGAPKTRRQGHPRGYSTVDRELDTVWMDADPVRVVREAPVQAKRGKCDAGRRGPV